MLEKKMNPSSPSSFFPLFLSHGIFLSKDSIYFLVEENNHDLL